MMMILSLFLWRYFVCRHEREAAATRAMQVIPSLSIQEFHDLCHDFWHAHVVIFFSRVCGMEDISSSSFLSSVFCRWYSSPRMRVANRSTAAAAAATHPLPLCNSLNSDAQWCLFLFFFLDETRLSPTHMNNLLLSFLSFCCCCCCCFQLLLLNSFWLVRVLYFSFFQEI